MPLSVRALSCGDCHGTRDPVDFRPLDDPKGERNIETGGFKGNHRTHMPNPITNGAAVCASCHPRSDSYSSGHRNGEITISDNINASPSKATYGKGTSFDQSSNPSQSTCSNVNCHFEKETLIWGSEAIARDDCGSLCHGSPPPSGSHGKKHGEYFGTGIDSCAKCHTDHSKESNPMAHALDACNRPLNVSFTATPNSGGEYSGDLSKCLPSQKSTKNGTCTNLYCHSDGSSGGAVKLLSWSDTRTTDCYTCHRGRTSDSTEANCATFGNWSAERKFCTPSLTMETNGHKQLVGPQWVRQYPCTYCHNSTIAPKATSDGYPPVDGNLNVVNHVNGKKDVVMDPYWNIEFSPLQAAYSSSTKTCYNVYCHSDGTVNPPEVRPFAWNQGATECNSCHGHPTGSCKNANCHDGRVDQETGKEWVLPAAFRNGTTYKWPAGEGWRSAMPMFENQGPGTDRANSHPRHAESNFSCDRCHLLTIAVEGKLCTECHAQTSGKSMRSEAAHIDPDYHVNKKKDVVFKDGGVYNPDRSCSQTACHTGILPPVWGGSVNSSVTCLGCHGAGEGKGDVDSFGYDQDTERARINSAEWLETGHGRSRTRGPYPGSGNPAASFSGNACWYCHDNNVIHNDGGNYFRLRQHAQFSNRFDKECVYCHMEGKDAECRSCHDVTETLAPRLENITAARFGVNHRPFAGGTQACMATDCHPSVAPIHKDSGVTRFWTQFEKEDVKNQYVMMGVCLKCHDDDSNDRCTSCHTPPTQNPLKYTIGFRPPGFANYSFIKPKVAKATSAHFGYKHFRAWEKDGVWKGGKFCWDCHDPHGDNNIYMIQKKVATTTDRTFGIPQSWAEVSFTKKESGADYARLEAPFNGICNVCHTTGVSKHYTKDWGDTHNQGRVCTTCHEHRFSDSHGDRQSCSSCHLNKPIPRHSAFGLPRDCTKCHTGTVGLRIDIIGQMKGKSHHVQGTEANNQHCYACHWESTKEGLIDLTYHTGYNYRTYTSVKNDKVDLVIWQPGTNPTVGVRPTRYSLYTTAVTYTASAMKADNPAARVEVEKITNHCVSCHSDQNNDNNAIFEGDCRTPRQYSWDGQSIAARYSQNGTTTWGKYNSATNRSVTKKDKVVKAFSAHGNAVSNGGGFNSYSGLNGTIPNTRAGGRNVQCYDCHSSHGTQLPGTTSSYVTFNGTRNGGNLKETQAGKGGYLMSYMASSNTEAGAINPYAAGAGQCFDCHFTRNSGITPWGYDSTFGAAQPIQGYRDSERFGQSPATPTMLRSPVLKGARAMQGGHLKASLGGLKRGAEQGIDGLCTPCHDPHGVSPSLGGNQSYAVPLLKGTWLSSPYREDDPPPMPSGPNAYGQAWGGNNNPNTNGPYTFAYPEGDPRGAQTGVSPASNYNLDRNTFGKGGRIAEDVNSFAGLCIQCHTKANLTDGTQAQWKGLDRIHRTVKGWGGNNEHAFACSKCHAPHATGLPRLMVTNCLDYRHRGNVTAGGTAFGVNGRARNAHGDMRQYRGYPSANVLGNSPDTLYTTSCHATIPDNPDRNNWPNNNSWNTITPW